ncbi:MAG: hypothetical protein COZ06_32385 [Armatimonadetes bacterium CG_4_10_14_3_um_filter_66_18]|nr:DUF4350 domain-containing protein [Armatimonadota bacterium]OIO95163.1 MAG: hypothetical protein AUJ96_27395 [Armatimonadetes bacterium CG2_30_66_41]PIU92951.1 MAG: hypothetical protein COS65_15230 [Armatimonadetes bacterium CG06_land_8_20_14_3_00_66_21]PIX40300.1 MAG: hypothetical protein COZ57_26220 [Armatimonadetes bacterium CG_4_8_14_3_um_filter_66_20]PIY37661.1 MAG: hypothetical protein COZ06_32385 [Armatimonadetes bacterium CG_4_10_14_3_um_filter_66_18]PIZ33395.1 MAG: hypothetical pro
MKKRKDLAILLVLLGAMVALTVLTLAGESWRDSLFEVFPLRTSYSSRPNGTRALFTTLDEVGLPVGRLHTSFSSLPKSGRLLFVIAPRRRITRDEWRALRKWVAGGRYACIGIEDQLVPQWAERAFDEGEDNQFAEHVATPTGDTAITRQVKEVRFRGPNRLIPESFEPTRATERLKQNDRDDRCAHDSEERCDEGGT